ncbi:GntR family transcriptional regulator [Anaerobacillus sp. MEB173]|uniref:GntR family transcriptional regulator n=1 Tax=Anaerobacillus sp. MEB173 TaxID=3383345 RepID=UPI003F90169C
MNIDKNSLQPMYEQISLYIEGEINSGSLGGGEKIPTEVNLMEMFDVSRITVRKAIKALIDKGLVEKKQGKGTFVKQRQFYHQLENFKGLYETLLEGGVNPETDLISFSEIKATQNIALALNLVKGKEIKQVLRVYYIKSVPVALAQINLHPKYSESITKEDAEKHPILELIANNTDSKIGKAHLEIFAETATELTQKYLNVSSKDAVLGAERILYTTEDEPIEHSLLWFRSDSYRFSVDLQGNPMNQRSEVNEFMFKPNQDVKNDKAE